MTVTQPPADERDADEPVIERNASATAPAERTHFPEIDGLRGLAVVGIVAYQTFRNAGAPWHAPFFERLVIDAGQGLVLFLAISGFVLAYPLLAALRANPPAFVDIGTFAVGRALRIYPAYLVTLCLATALHPLAVLFNYPALARATPQIGVGTFVRAAAFAGNGLGNDGLRAAGLFVLAAIAFPLLLALATSRPRAVALLAVAAGLADAFTGAHAISIGFVVPLTLGILAAELRLRDHRLQGFWPAVVVAGVALALLFEKHVALLPGATAAPDALRVDPFWSLAAFGILMGTGGSTVLRRVAGFVALRRLGAASYAISLVAMPIAGFAVHQLPTRIGYPAEVLVAACAALAGGFALCRGIDRAFANGIARRASALRPGALLDRALSRLRVDRIAVAWPTPKVARNVTEPVAPEPVAPAPAPDPGPLAVLSTRSGSPEELAADIFETKRRLTERAVAPVDAEPEHRADSDDEEAPDLETPGFYRRATPPRNGTRPIAAPRTPMPAFSAPSRTAPQPAIEPAIAIEPVAVPPEPEVTAPAPTPVATPAPPIAAPRRSIKMRIGPPRATDENPPAP